MPFAATLAATPPFDFDRTLRYLHTSPSAIVERVEGRCYLRAVRLEGAPLLLRASSVGTEEEPRLLVELLGGEATERQGALALDLVQRLFDLAAPAEEFYRIAAADPVFGPVALRCRGVRPLLIPEPFEALVWAIIGQQINIRFAAKLKAALVDEYGGTIMVDGAAYPLFPEPATLAAADPERLRALQFSRQKIAYVIGIAQAVESGALDLEAVRALPPEEALAALIRIKGIGRWTAEYLLLRGFGQRDAFPAGDGGLKRAVGQWYGLGRLATEEEVRTIGAAWAPWRGYAALHWWFALQQGFTPEEPKGGE
ncbi:MAG: DNA-3-methyladenine glycosylase 2 [Chloroflexi bacterium]|nr:DNA-3-methyladenine glycosylase 2 [Chloroflexota bacterium]